MSVHAAAGRNDPEPLPLVRLEHVNLHLQGHHVLKDVNWRLLPGEHWAFTGRNGSGKSTLLRVIRGDQWIDPDGGVRAYGFDGVPSGGVISARARIGFVAPEQQEYYTRLELPISGRAVVASGFDDTVYLQRGLRADEAEALDALLERLRLVDVSAQRMRSLSTGQMRRLLIARALVRRPRLLVLDEFTNGLDRDARREILGLLESLAADVQMIFASHRAEEFIGAVTHRATVHDGRIARRAVTTAPRPRPLRRSAAPSAAADAIVSVHGANVYRGRTLVLRDVDWEIRAGMHTAVFGANGAGKSTFAGLVAGTIHPATGEVRRFGRPGPFDLWRIKERVVHLSDELQNAYTIDETVAGVVLSGFAFSVGLWHEPDAAQRAVADRLLERLELDALRARGFRGLSFGERRKVLIARALVRPPALLILDEIWNGLDAHFRALLADLLHELAADGTTLLLIAHHEEDLPDLIVRRFTIDGGRVHSA